MQGFFLLNLFLGCSFVLSAPYGSSIRHSPLTSSKTIRLLFDESEETTSPWSKLNISKTSASLGKVDTTKSSNVNTPSTKNSSANSPSTKSSSTKNSSTTTSSAKDSIIKETSAKSTASSSVIKFLSKSNPI